MAFLCTVFSENSIFVLWKRKKSTLTTIEHCPSRTAEACSVSTMKEAFILSRSVPRTENLYLENLKERRPRKPMWSQLHWVRKYYGVGMPFHPFKNAWRRRKAKRPAKNAAAKSSSLQGNSCPTIFTGLSLWKKRWIAPSAMSSEASW